MCQSAPVLRVLTPGSPDVERAVKLSSLKELDPAKDSPSGKSWGDSLVRDFSGSRRHAVCVIVSWILSFSRTRTTSPRSVRIRRHFVRSGCCGSPHHPSPVDNVRSGLRSPSILPTSYPTKHEIHLTQAHKQRRERGKGAMKLENERCGTFVHFLLNPSHVLGTKHRQSE